MQKRSRTGLYTQAAPSRHERQPVNWARTARRPRIITWHRKEAYRTRKIFQDGREVMTGRLFTGTFETGDCNRRGAGRE